MGTLTDNRHTPKLGEGHTLLSYAMIFYRQEAWFANTAKVSLIIVPSAEPQMKISITYCGVATNPEQNGGLDYCRPSQNDAINLKRIAH